MFRPPRWIVALTATAALLFLAAALLLYHLQGWSWMSLVAAALIPVSLAGLADAMTSRIELRQERLVVVRNLRKREYSRDAFTSVSWGKGVPVSLQFAKGGWLHLPEIVSSGLGLANTLRAWVRSRKQIT
jgi:hypothetical protein